MRVVVQMRNCSLFTARSSVRRPAYGVSGRDPTFDVMPTFAMLSVYAIGASSNESAEAHAPAFISENRKPTRFEWFRNLSAQFRKHSSSLEERTFEVKSLEQEVKQRSTRPEYRPMRSRIWARALGLFIQLCDDQRTCFLLIMASRAACEDDQKADLCAERRRRHLLSLVVARDVHDDEVHEIVDELVREDL
jgi:hypothetical protein